MNNHKSNLLLTLTLLVAGVMFFPLISSCTKNGNINPTEAKIEYQVINLSYDALPLNLYVKLLKQNTSVFRYPTPSGYFGLTTIDTPFQIRSAATGSVVNLLKIDSTNLSRETKYSLFITGSRAQNTLSYIFLVDTSTVPRVGRGKIRFVNASPRVNGGADGLVLTANETEAFKQQKFNTASDYIELPAGIYDFKIKPFGSPTQTLEEIENTTIQDGRLYTIYAYGRPSFTDSTAFGAAILTNR
ncbi:DUF4397 domain-containing protein [Mucilaginibacter sp. UR6-1]|uniref:DUF4397 domain-containing protein n=1 Tax=Mucilaginibacter sp. UR6-1 TaxID=1435643 RepID=UPI001E586225|nr:DUF4397 domain-containing protein [Mucilaginibacter sp. UR6-1]MCC8408677.1 DUF4397 domain-containing protein [Mucilaginibacter sp. UR6-1]